MVKIIRIQKNAIISIFAKIIWMKKTFLCFTVISAIICVGCASKVNVTSPARCDIRNILELSYDVSDGMTASYKLEWIQDSLIQVKWTFCADRDIADAHINVDIVVPDSSGWWMMPAISYNGNPWGAGLEPKGASDRENGWWTYSYRRSPIPGAIYSEYTDYAVATWCDVPQCAEDDFSFSIMPGTDRTTHRYIWPEEEMPRAYTSRDVYSDGWRKTYGMKKGETRTLNMYVSIAATEENHRAISHFLKKAWTMAEKVKFDIPDKQTLWAYGIRFAKESLWDPTETCIGFRTGIAPDLGSFHEGLTDYGDHFDVEPGTERKWRKMQGYAGGWVGRNIYQGCAILADYLLNGDKESLEIGLATLDHWAANAPCPSGMVRSELPGGGVDACNMGTEVLGFRDAYHIAAKCGYYRPEYLKIFLEACDAAMATQREDGCYARSWTDDEKGMPTSYDGFTSTYLICPMLEAYRETKDAIYLNSAKKAFEYFTGEFNKLGFTTAGALDTYCIDKESCLPLFNAAVRMYDMLGEQKYLDDAVALVYYLSTWMWVYDGVYPSDDSFTEYGFHTFGGTSVSTQHQCLDNFGLPPVPEMRRLAELTGDPQWKEKADALYNFCCQLISDGETEINGRIRPVGGQSEAFFQAEWYLYGNRSRFDNWLVAWPNVIRLEFQMVEHAEELGLKDIDLCRHEEISSATAEY